MPVFSIKFFNCYFKKILSNPQHSRSRGHYIETLTEGFAPPKDGSNTNASPTNQ